ncbi:MAG: glycosyltransferase family 4 protein [Gammaproteobacteria bacterium]
MADRARRAGARWVEVVPTVVDIERYCIRPTARQDAFTIGWMGTPCTAQYLKYVQVALHTLGKTGRAKVLLVGSGAVTTEGVVTEHREWSEETEVADIQDFDVGIMPLLDGPWERGKCGYKLIQYMACGKPVVASPVGVNCQIVDHGVNGFLSESESAWRSALSELMHSRKLCASMGSAGRRLVEQRYCLQVTAPRIADLMVAALGRGG